MRLCCFGFFAFVLLISTAETADDAVLKKAVKANVEEMNDALLKDDFAKVVELTHPKVVERAGGPKKLIESMEIGTKTMKSKGYSITSVETGEPSASVRNGPTLYIVVPFTMKMATPEGKMRVNSFVIGSSSNDAKTWSFINGDLGAEQVKQILPDLPKELKLPKLQQATLEKE